MYGYLLLLHILAATIWTGGHIVLSLVVLPDALKTHSLERLLKFESTFEKIGLPALIIQIITGLMLAYRLLPDVHLWFDLTNPIAHGIIMKLGLLGLTIAFALGVKLRVLPHPSDKTLVQMAWHIIPVTLFSIMFIFVGVAFSAGWLY